MIRANHCLALAGLAVLTAVPIGCGSGLNPAFVSPANAMGLPGQLNVPIDAPDELPARETLDLTTAAPAGGITFQLTSDDPAIVTVPASVTVPEGLRSVSFPLKSWKIGETVVRATAAHQPDFVSKVRAMYAVCSMWGDSLTQGNEDQSGVTVETALQSLGYCGTVYNEGIGGQWSTQIAVRNGALPSTATVVSGKIPSSGATEILVPRYAGAVSDQGPPQSITISGVDGLASATDTGYRFVRSTPGQPVDSPPDAPVTVHPPHVDTGLVIIWSGNNNYQHPEDVKADIAAMVAHLPSPKRFLILSVVNGDEFWVWKNGGQTPYPTMIQLNSDLAATYPNNFLDIRALEVAAYNPGNAQDVIDFGHDVPPSTFRAQDFHGRLMTNIPDGQSCNFRLTQGYAWYGSTVTLDEEKIYISQTDGTTVSGCVRGYASTRATAHAAGSSYTGLDPIHQNGPVAGFFIASRINDWMRSH